MTGQPLGGGGIPYGYRYEALGKHRGRYVIDEIEATWVRRMFEWLLEGRSVRAITKKLNMAGAPTKKGGKSWGKSSVHRVLTYSGYTGEAYWNKTRKIEPKSSGRYSPPRKNKAVLRPKEEWIPVQIPQIIDNATFESAQTTLKRNAALASRNAKHFYSLRGRVKCGSCGHTMYGVPNRGNRYYRCGRRDSTLVTKCRGKSMRADLAEEAVWAEVESILDDPSVITTELKLHHLNLGDDVDRIQSDIQLIKAALADCDRQQRRWLDAYRDDAITSDELRNELDAVRRTRAGLDERLGQLLERSREVDVDGMSYQALESYVNAVRLRIAEFTDEEKLLAMEALGAEATWNGDSLYLNLSIPVPNHVEQLRPATF